MTHPAHNSTRLDPEERVTVRARGEFLIRTLTENGLSTRATAIGEQVRVERWQARDLEARELAELV